MIGGLSYDTPIGDFAKKCAYTKVLTSDIQRNQQYNRPMAAIAQQFLNIYEMQARLRNMDGIFWYLERFL